MEPRAKVDVSIVTVERAMSCQGAESFEKLGRQVGDTSLVKALIPRWTQNCILAPSLLITDTLG